MRKLSLIAVVLALSLFISAGKAMAFPSLGDVLDEVALNAIYPSGINYVTLTDLTDPATSMAEIWLEAAGYASQNIFGIYNYNKVGDITQTPSSNEMLPLFAGVDAVGDWTEVTFDLTDETATCNGVTRDVGTIFGFYLISPEGTFFSDETLNDNNFEYGLIYDTRGLSGSSSGLPSPADIVVAFEDLYGGGDEDYDDLVIGMTDVAPVPEPASLVLLGSGLLGLAALSRRKRG